MLVVNELEGGIEQDRAAVAIVQRWAQNSPGAAAAWVSQFADGPLRDAAAQNLLVVWTAKDAEAAGKWLHELPNGPLRDIGLAAYAQALAGRDRISAAMASRGGM